MIKNIFFDLDGTLLPMDVERFMELYFDTLCRAVCPYIDASPDMLKKAISSGVEAIYKNDGAITNKMRFWNSAAGILGPDIIDEIPLFNGYYENEFIYTKEACDPTPLALDAVTMLKNKGYNLAVATNPLFPKTAIERRIKWAGLAPEDFSLVTSYETSKYCKPNPLFFAETCEAAGVNPGETLMVGNDVDEDMPAEKAGLSTYLITDYIINRGNKKYDKYTNGTFRDFYGYCISLPNLNEVSV